MERYIAFLRAINVGGHTVRMERLRDLFGELELDDVTTFIASGNVIFRSPTTDTHALERRIESHLREALGYEVATFIRSAPELAAVATHAPFPAEELAEAGTSLHICFLHEEPADEKKRSVMALRTAIDDLHLHQRELYWLRRNGIGASVVSGARIEKALGMPATIRNANTVRKLAASHAGQS